MPIVSTEEFVSKSFDYLIVGGGTGGLALAARLSEDSDVLVGVIEAGVHHVEAPGIDIPGLIGSTMANPTYDWMFFSVPQPQLNNRAVLQPRGKGLGGSSLINFLVSTRPSKEEYDALELLGNHGWNWESFLEYTKKSENTYFRPIAQEDAQKFAIRPDFAFHGTSGPVQKSYPIKLTEIHAHLLDTGEALGIPRNFDPSNGFPVGGSTIISVVDHCTAIRSSSASAYFEPNAARPNLLVLTGAHATKVLLKSEGDQVKAIGVELVKDGKKVSVSDVRNDVVLSAGAFQTPQILELSGIGNTEILQKHGIIPVIDLPGVGENLQDHVLVRTIAQVRDHYETVDVLMNPEGLKEQQELYQHQEGFLASVPAPAFLFPSAHQLGNGDSDVKAWLARSDALTTTYLREKTHPAIRKGLEKQYEMQRKWFADKTQPQAELILYIGHQPLPGLTPIPGKKYTTIVACLMHPLSRGDVHVASGDPLAPPAINPNYLGNEFDFELLLDIVKFTLKVFTTGALGEDVIAVTQPPSAVLEGSSAEAKEEQLRAWVKENCGPVWHPVGTAAMLPREDGGVVDSKLKVYGTTNLRVVDLSVLPLELSTHTQTAVYAIAEKAADIFKAEAANRKK